MYKDMKSQSTLIQNDTEAVLGKVQAVNIVGFLPTISTNSTPQDIWSDGGDYVFLDAGETLKVFSSDAADTALGTGGRLVRVQGLDENLDKIEEFISLNGTTAVDTIQSFYRVNEVLVLRSGTDGMNVGSISVAKGSDVGVVLGKVNIGEGLDKTSVYTSSRNVTSYFETISVQPLRAQGALISATLFIRNAIKDLETIWISSFDIGGNESGPSTLDLRCFGPSVGGLDMRMTVQTVSANDVAVFSFLTMKEISKI